MKARNATFSLLTILILSVTAAHGQSLFDIGFPSSKHPYPDDKGSDKVNPGIATGSSSGLYMRFGEDIAKLCATYGIPLTSGDPNRFLYPKFRVNVYATQGGFDSVKRLRYEKEVQLAVVQSDLRYFAMERFKDEVDPKKREAWRQIADEIKLILPLYKEKIHIVCRPEDKGRFKDLAGLLQAGATVNVGQVSSGGMITCALLEELITGSRDWKGKGTWKKRYYPEDAALEMLVGRNPRETLDAVMLIGGVPYPALEKFGVDMLIEERRRFLGLGDNTKVEAKAQLALLPFGAEAGDIIDSSGFGGYHPAQIKTEDYEFMRTASDEVVETRGVYACLVSHSVYGKSPNDHKVEWVRHILFRVLSKLDVNSDYGLPYDFGVPRAGKKWKEVYPLSEVGLGSESKWEELYGWPRHDDEFIRKMVDVWASGQGVQQGGPSSSIIDPIKLF